MTTDLVGPLLVSMLECAATALSPAPGRSLVASGSMVAWDDCCEGQVWTRLVSLMPGVSDSAQSCGPLTWTATIGIGVLRCAAVVDDRGNPPAAEVLTDEALRGTADAFALSEAIQCCMTATRLKMLNWAPLGPEGGCVGGEWQVSVMVDNPSC